MTYKKVDMVKVQQKAADVRLLVLDVDGVLTDGRLHFDAEGQECKVFHVRDGYGLRCLIKAGFEVAIISGRRCKAVEKRLAELGIRHAYLGVSDKVAVFRDLLRNLSLSANQAAYVGDDAPDMECMKQAGLAVAVADAHPELDAIADWHTHLGGGMGAVREVCDMLLSSRH